MNKGVIEQLAKPMEIYKNPKSLFVAKFVGSPQMNIVDFNDGEQWYDYSGGLIYGIKVNKNLGYFVEGKYNKYWNREWYDFKLGLNYTIF